MKYSFLLLSVFTLSFSTLVARANEMSHTMEARRPVEDDCKNPPGDYRNAEHPYAKKPDGCSGIINSPKEVRDKWGPVDFTPACNKHDRCYYTEGSVPGKCNAQFLKDLYNACKNGTSKMVFGNRVRNPALELPCREIAEGYKVGVDIGVDLGIFTKAQRLQRSYNRWYSRCH